MALAIETFSNQTGGGSAFFKAVGHPLCLELAHGILGKITAARRAAAFDPQQTLAAFLAVHSAINGHKTEDKLQAVYAQDVLRFGESAASCKVSPITDLPNDDIDLLFVPLFDAEFLVKQIRPILPAHCAVITLDDMRLPERFLADTRRYLNPVNFATNMLFFREQQGLHTRLVTANYWSAYGAKEPFVWGRLFDGDGNALADFEKPLGGAHHTFCLDSVELKRELNLDDFCGQVFLHVARAAGHDIVKYVADTYGDVANGKTRELSCTHDANSWPADFYAGVPAPEAGDEVLLWVQNSHPAPIPAGVVGANIMGDEAAAYYGEEIPPFATHAINLGELLPNAVWPAQIEIRAGRHFVRPRYEVINRAGRRRINHANVERIDLSPDQNIPNLQKYCGKGYILPAPILPKAQYRSWCLPTPMSTGCATLPIAAAVYNARGEELARHFFGCLPRRHESLLDLSALAAKLDDNENGHVELTYDFRDGGAGDGWLHALFRYVHVASEHMAETSFGAHMFNHLLTYKNEPQSYKGPPPGLTTRLFLRISPPPTRTFCNLIYSVGVRWHDTSETHLELKNCRGEDVAQKVINIAAGGSFAFSCDEVFSPEEIATAGDLSYVIIRDSTCRLFGYHGAAIGDAFAFDHMFGF